MKVLMLCPSLSGSSFSFIKNVIHSLPAECDVLAVGPTFGESAFLKTEGFHTETLEPSLKSPRQLAVVSLLPKNIARLKKADYDLVHTFKTLPNTAPAAAIARRATHKPTVLTIDDYDYASAQGFLKKNIIRWCEKYRKETDALTVCSKTLQKIYGGQLIYQSIDKQNYDPKKHDGSRMRKRFGLEDKIIIGHGGTLFPHKGIDTMIRAVQSLRDDRLRILLAKMGANVDSYVKMSGRETIWTRRDEIPHENVPEYTAATDIYVIPTKDTPYARAQTPQKLFEAMAMGRAIVASRISDIPDILGDAGLLVEPGDIKGLAEAIRKLADDKTLRTQLGKRARERYLKHYSSDILGKQMMDVYRSVL